MNVKKVALFIVLSYLLSCAVVPLYFALGGRNALPWSLVLDIAYMFMPLVAAVAVQKLIYRAPLKGPLRISLRPNRWFIVAWLLPVTFPLATLGVSLLLPRVTYSTSLAGMFEHFRKLVMPAQFEDMEHLAKILPIHPFWLALVEGMITGPTINAVGAFGEELGWRGLLLRELEAKGIWKASAVIGVVWGFWHAPMILLGKNYPEHPLAGILMMTGMTVLLSPWLAYITLRSGSVIAAAILHGTFNATAQLALIGVHGGNDLTVGVGGVAGLVVLLLADIGLFVFDRYSPIKPVVK